MTVSASLLTDEENVPLGVVLAAMDITNRRRFQKELSEREEQLRQSQKMEAIGQLAGGIAHDFNNLLTAIIGNSTLALTTMPADDPHKALVAEIHEVAERAAGLTKQILAFSRRQMLRPEVVCLNQVIVDMESLLRRSLGEDVELQLDLASDLSTARSTRIRSARCCSTSRSTHATPCPTAAVCCSRPPTRGWARTSAGSIPRSRPASTSCWP